MSGDTRSREEGGLDANAAGLDAYSKWLNAQQALMRDREHEWWATVVGYGLSAGPLALVVNDFASTGEFGVGSLAATVCAVAAGISILGWRWTLRSRTPAGLSRSRLRTFVWSWVSFVAALCIATYLFAGWNSQRGALSIGQYATFFGTAIAIYTVSRLLGWAAGRLSGRPRLDDGAAANIWEGNGVSHEAISRLQDLTQLNDAVDKADVALKDLGALTEKVDGEPDQRAEEVEELLLRAEGELFAALANHVALLRDALARVEAAWNTSLTDALMGRLATEREVAKRLVAVCSLYLSNFFESERQPEPYEAPSPERLAEQVAAHLAAWIQRGPSADPIWNGTLEHCGRGAQCIAAGAKFHDATNAVVEAIKSYGDKIERGEEAEVAPLPNMPALLSEYITRTRELAESSEYLGAVGHLLNDPAMHET